MQIYALVFAALFFLMQGCNSCNPEVKDDSQLKVFRYNQASGIASLDPAFAKDQAGIWAAHHLFNTLLELDSALNIRPSLATSFSVSEDGLHYTFRLRTDVRFHDDGCFEGGRGRLMTARDVVYSFQRIMDEKTASPGAWIFNGRVDGALPFEATDDSTFVLHLQKPFPPVTGIVCMQYCSVVPREAVEKYGAAFRAHPVGTGAFRLKSWQEGNALILVRNPHYWERQGAEQLPFMDGIKVTFIDNKNGNPHYWERQGAEQLPFMDGIKVTFIDNKKTEFLSFKQGELDFVSGIDAAYVDETIGDDGALKPELSGRFQLMKSPYLNTEYFGFNLQAAKGSPLGDKRVRQAIGYGIDRREMLKYLRNGIGRAAEQGFTPYGLPSFDDSLAGFSYQPERAKALLKQAGYRGQELKLYTNENYKDIAVFAAKQLEQIGLNVKVEINQPAMLREWMSKGEVVFFRGSWIADYPDAENYFTVFYGPNSAPPNYTRFDHPVYNRLYEQALLETDEAKRFALYRDLERILIDEAPVVPLYYDEVLRYAANRVKGLQPNALNLLDLRRVRLE